MKVNQIEIHVKYNHDLFIVWNIQTGHNGCNSEEVYIFLMPLCKYGIYSANAAYKISDSATVY